MIDRIDEGIKTSIERKTFPSMAADKQIFAFDLDSFWMDLGKPQDFVLGLEFFLNFIKSTGSDGLAKGPNIIGNVIIHESAKLAETALVGPNVAIGEGCTVGEGVRLKNCVLLPGSIVG